MKGEEETGVRGGERMLRDAEKKNRVMANRAVGKDW